MNLRSLFWCSWVGLLLGSATAARSAAPQDRPLWSLRPLSQPTVPTGAHHPIDAFIRAKLAEKDLSPSGEADRRTLLRRLSYDLTGLPPTLEEIETFLADSDPQAFEKRVDRYLSSPRYGEAWGRHWLDVAHYADTHGNDHDYARPNAWPYRDYVIRSLNEDKPYGRFVEEQVAGDALFPEDPQATVALGFLAAGPWDETLMVGVREDTFDHHLAQVLDRDDMVTTVMSTFQGLTVHCARCHDHKFDPITQREYYALQAVFAGVDRADRLFDDDPKLHQRRHQLLRKRSAIERRDPAVITSLESTEIQQRVSSLLDRQTQRDQAWERLEITSIVSASSPETRFSLQPDGSWFVSGPRPDKDTFIVTGVTKERGLRALRLEALPDDRLPGKGPGRYEPSGNFHLSEVHLSMQPSSGATSGAVRVELTRATADHSDGGDAVANAIDGRMDTHWSVHPRYGEAHEAVFEFKDPVGYEGGTTFMIRLEHQGTTGHQLGRFRLSLCTDKLPADQRPPLPIGIAALVRKANSQRSAEDRRTLALQVVTSDLDSELSALPAPRRVYAVSRDFAANGSLKPAATPRPIHLLTRGDLNKPGELVGPGALSCVAVLGGQLSLSSLDDESARRSALAHWLTDARNPLTWRSIVNRVWHYHFGRGLSETPNDLGRMGSEPSHPELLDWLAVWFRDEARGSLKALHRLIVTSQTYRQQVANNESAATVDADNRWLWRMNRTRLSAEQIRDSLLTLSGTLDLTMGGPPAVQFVDKGKITFMPDGGAPAFLDYDHFPPDSAANHRRAIYRFVFRTVPDPLMDALDAPDGGALTPVRNQSTTAVQAFALLNNAFVVQQCELMAKRVATSSQSKGGVAAAFRLILQRDPTPDEEGRFDRYVERHGLANACQVLMNSNEFLYLD